MMEPIYQEAIKGYGGGLSDAFRAKQFTTITSAPFHNQGRVNPKEMSFITSNSQFDKIASKLYTEWKGTHPLVITPTDIKSPTKVKLKQDRYFKQFLTWLKQNEPTRISPMLWEGYRGLKSSNKPKGGARLSSSWIRGMKVTGPHEAKLKLGNKWYTYAFGRPDDLAKFLQCDSMGRAVNEIKKTGHSHGLYAAW